MSRSKRWKAKLFWFWGTRLVSADNRRHAATLLRGEYSTEDVRKNPLHIRPVEQSHAIAMTTDGGETSFAVAPDECARIHYPGIVHEV